MKTNLKFVTAMPPGILALHYVPIVGGLDGSRFVEPVDMLDLPLPDPEDVAGVFPVLFDDPGLGLPYLGDWIL
jgi:hypothetical protein